MGITRWDPRSRAGAVAVRQTKTQVDVRATRALTQAVADWATYQGLAGDMDAVETSPIQANYDWRSYLHEEAAIAQKREDRLRAREKKSERAPPPAPAPTHYYA